MAAQIDCSGTACTFRLEDFGTNWLASTTQPTSGSLDTAEAMISLAGPALTNFGTVTFGPVRFNNQLASDFSPGWAVILSVSQALDSISDLATFRSTGYPSFCYFTGTWIKAAYTP
jgi:hypothetical protein